MDANARALDARATQERAAGSVRGERRMEDAKRLLSQQQAEFGHSGGGVGGSAGVVMGETGRRGLENSNLEVWQGENRARGFEDEAAIQRWGAKRRRAAIPLEVGSAILTGSSKIASGGGFGGTSSVADAGDGDIYDQYDRWYRGGSPSRGSASLPYG